MCKSDKKEIVSRLPAGIQLKFRPNTVSSSDTAIFGQKQSLNVQEIRSDSPPAVANMLNRLIAENYGFQNDLAGVTSGTVTELLASKFGMSPERAAALVVAVRLGVAAFNAAAMQKAPVVLQLTGVGQLLRRPQNRVSPRRKPMVTLAT